MFSANHSGERDSMDEDTVNSLETSDDGWGEDVDLEDVDFSEDDDEGKPEPTAEADPPKPEDQTEDKQEKPVEEVPPDKPAETDQFKLKYLGEEKTVTRDEAVVLAQKGMDYDRIRSKFDALSDESAKNSESVAFLQELAQKQGLSVPDLIDQIRAKDISDKEQVDMSVALGRVKNLRTERQLEAEKEKLTEKHKLETTEQAEKQATEQKRKQDISDFVKTYPDVKDFKTIPQDVWKAVQGGETLVSAYTRYENKRLSGELEKLNKALEAERQNTKNKTRATGSQTTTGKAKYEDEIDKYWND